MGPAIACPFEISGRGADVTNLRSPFRFPAGRGRDKMRTSFNHGGLRSSSTREHLVRGDISLLTEVRFARRAVSDLRKAPRLFFGGEHADATTYTGHVHDAG